MSFYERLKVLTIAQQKGGVGKTTTTRTIAEYMARFTRRRVLMIDFDPQCNLSMRFLNMEKELSRHWVPPTHPEFDENEIYEDGWNGKAASSDFFTGGVILPYETHIPNLHILPGNGLTLRQAEQHQADESERLIISHLRQCLKDPVYGENYDLILIDTAPNRLSLTQSAIRASTHVLIPFIPEPMNVETLTDMLDLWRDENDYRNNDELLEIVGLLPTMFDTHGSALHRGLLEAISSDMAFKGLITPFVIHKRIAVSESDHAGSPHKSVFDLPESNKSRKEMLTMCRFMEQALFGTITEI